MLTSLVIVLAIPPRPTTEQFLRGVVICNKMPTYWNRSFFSAHLKVETVWRAGADVNQGDSRSLPRRWPLRWCVCVYLWQECTELWCRRAISTRSCGELPLPVCGKLTENDVCGKQLQLALSTRSINVCS